jgi:hypothetical protein
MSWAPHTVPGFLAGVAKKGITIEVLECVHQVGPNKQGAKGSYSVYRLVERPVLTETNITVSARASECAAIGLRAISKAESPPEL